jgi:hypothetical protein
MLCVAIIQTVIYSVSAILLLLQFRQSASATKAEHARRGQEATVQFFSDGSQRIFEARVKLETELGTTLFLKPLSEEAIKKIEESADLRLSVNHMLGFFEDLSTGVNEGVFDLRLADKLLGATIIQAYRCLMPYVRRYRTLNGSNRYFDQFEFLAHKLEATEATSRSNKSRVV